MFPATSPRPFARFLRIAGVLMLVAMGCQFIFGERQSPHQALDKFVVQERLGMLTYSTNEAGQAILVNTFTVSSGTDEAMSHAKRFLVGVQAAKLQPTNDDVVRFVAQTPLVDSLGHETLTPLLRFELNLHQQPKIAFQNLASVSLARFVTSAEILQPAITEDVAQFCSEFPQQETVPFCVMSARSLTTKHMVSPEG